MTRRLVLSEVSPSQRILILGASGWLGQTLQDMLPAEIDTYCVASYCRAHYRLFSESEIKDFNPTLVVNFACVTKGYGEPGRRAEIDATNEILLSRFGWSSRLPNVRSILTLSSGASLAQQLDPRMNAYRNHKLREEKKARELATESRNVVVARAWSLSGPFVSNPEQYALSDFVLQAARGEISVKSTSPTYRNYTSAGDFLFVAMRLLLDKWNGTLDSGGEVIEVGSLAERVRAVVNPTARIYRNSIAGEARYYVSDNRTWHESCRYLNFSPLSLDEQIHEVRLGIT